jgi:hypothetical protein
MLAHKVKARTRGDALFIEREVLSAFGDRRLAGRDWVACSLDEARQAISAVARVTGDET